MTVKKRRFRISVECGSEAAARELSPRIFRNSRKTGHVIIEREGTDGPHLFLEGTHVCKGNSRYDIHRAVAQAARGLGRGRDGRQAIIPTNIHVKVDQASRA